MSLEACVMRHVMVCKPACPYSGNVLSEATNGPGWTRLDILGGGDNKQTP
jgi:hypothetical protein